MFSSKIESIEQQTNENEGVSPNPLKETNENGAAVNSSPQGASTNFQKFAAGAAFATPSGFAQDASGSKKKPGRPRKHPKKNSSIAGHPRANENSSLDAQLTQTAPPEKKFVSIMELTAPSFRFLSAIAASYANDDRFALSKEETEEIAKAFDQVAHHWFPDLEQIDPKTASLISFSMTVGMIYSEKLSKPPKNIVKVASEAAATVQPEPKAETVSFSSSIPSTDTMKNGLKFGMGPLG